MLRDGLTVQVRPADALAVAQMLKRLSRPSRWRRFFSGRPDSGK